MKKQISLFLSIVLVLMSLAACQTAKETTPKETTPPAAEEKQAAEQKQTQKTVP